MTPSDDVILEFLDEIDICVPPRVISFNRNLSQPTVDRRLSKLEKADLVQRYSEPRGYTEITDNGRAYLRGDIDAEDLEAAV